MKITMYELLGLVKDGKAPKIIKYKDTLYEYDSGDEFYFNDGWSLYREFPENGNCLNDEVEIIEEEKKIPEKLPEWATSREDKEYTNDEYHCLVVARKVDEIIDYLQYLKSKGE